MCILAYIEIDDQKVKKSSLELATYAGELAKKLNTEAVGIAVGKIPTDELAQAGTFGLQKIFHVPSSIVEPTSLAATVAKAATVLRAPVVVLPKSSRVDSFAGRLAVKLKANMASNLVEVPNISADGFFIKKSIFTGKAFAVEKLSAENKVLVIRKNAIQAAQTGNPAAVENFEAVVVKNSFSVLETTKASGDLLLTEAEFVVSGGRGMKGPENWYLIENFAKALGAATGCSKPVSDMDWRPHHEHVGQTGVKVSPNIYFAVGISGAIQHLAGVNSSKCIVVINKDPEAPFFKAADYGIVGDAFEILPKLTEAVKQYK